MNQIPVQYGTIIFCRGPYNHQHKYYCGIDLHARNLPSFRKKLTRKYNHDRAPERFENPAVRKSVEADLDMINALNQVLKKLEWHIEKSARQHDYHTLYLLRSIPGVGQILALVIMYEIHDVRRFPNLSLAAITAKKSGPHTRSSLPLIGSIWPAPNQDTDLLSNDDRVLPLTRVTP